MRTLLTSYFLLLFPCLAIAGLGEGVRRFDFLPVTSQRKFGVYIRGSTDPSLRGRDAPCGDLYQQYLRLREEGVWTANATTNGTAASLIYETSNCILEALSPLESQQIQLAAVLLGLTPVLFSTLGPTIGEIGLISFRRPFLGLFLGIGTVITFPSRVLSNYDDRIHDILRRPPGLGRKVNDICGRHFGRLRTRFWLVIGLAQYILAAAAAANIFFTSWDLSVRSVLSLESTKVWWLPAWSGTPVFGFMIMTASIYATYWMRRAHTVPSDEYELQQPLTLEDHHPGTPRTTARSRRSGWTLAFFPSCLHPAVPLSILDYHWATELAHNIATVFAFLQILFGTIVFSSLLFVAAADAAVILIRYAMSILVCRIVIALELGGMTPQATADIHANISEQRQERSSKTLAK